jgi:predicted DNA-binding transcriptional regulator YafY
MKDQDAKRISRLTAIAMQLQTKRLLTAAYLSDRFGVSVRTIYRDIKALEQAGVPVLTVEGKGFTLMDGYRVPPIMFTEAEAAALITAEQLIMHSTDASLAHEYQKATEKVRAVLQQSTRQRMEVLTDRIAVSPALKQSELSQSLSIIQKALTAYLVLRIDYHARHSDAITVREVEPFALYYSGQESWLLIAYCRLRRDFRMFSLDRITSVKILDEVFEPHQLTLAEYLREKEKNFTTLATPLS